MRRKERIRQQNLALILETLFHRTAMGYTLLFYAEEIAEETLSDIIYVNNVPIYSVNNKPEYIRNRRLILRTLKRRSEIKPHKIVLKGKNWKLKTAK